MKTNVNNIQDRNEGKFETYSLVDLWDGNENYACIGGTLRNAGAVDVEVNGKTETFHRLIANGQFKVLRTFTWTDKDGVKHDLTKGQIIEQEIWPRYLADEDEFEAYRGKRFADLILRFGYVPKTDAVGNIVTDENGDWQYTDVLGAPKWIDFVTPDGELVRLSGPKAPFVG